MYITGTIRVKSVIPEALSKLGDIAFNLWWTWNPEVAELFMDMDENLWSRLGGNPVQFLQEISRQRVTDMVNDTAFMDRYQQLVERFDRYMTDNDTWFAKNYPSAVKKTIAYFSAEFGLHEILPVYSGGLGILAGDHCKSASDLGIPLIGIGLFYKQGYFKQRINHEGWQETVFNDLNTSHMPLKQVTLENGTGIVIDVDLPGRKLYAQLWQVQVGRVAIYLLDTDIEKNSPVDRSLTARLYGGDQETRIQQEILLGIGGVKALDALGIEPSVYHMNEGHSAFLSLELLRKLMQEKGLSFREAMEGASSQLVFTTHTPVPAGNDVFPVHMIDKYFDGFRNSLGIDRDTFLSLGTKGTEHYNFNMTVLALNLSGRRNGVSELHGAVTRNIFNDIWGNLPEDEVPVTHITNGVHTLSWMSRVFRELYDDHLAPGWKDKISEPETWKSVANIPDKQLWEKHCMLKKRMVEYVRGKISEQARNNGLSPEMINEAGSLLHPDILTLGFARRFATYKRADLIFKNIERIKTIINNPDRPVQIIFAGKAHPADRPAHDIIKYIHEISMQEGFKGRVVLLENYNIALARHLVAGVDVWLNNPRRPLEASGTSGQKACINGIVNFSVLDGWWCEGYTGRNGWTIGDDTFYSNEYSQDNADSMSIYDTLENRIIPLYYDRDNTGVPHGWVNMMKESIASAAWKYSTQRMLEEYTQNMYLPTMDRIDSVLSSDCRICKELAGWKSFIRSKWHDIHIIAQKKFDRLDGFETVSGEPLHMAIDVNLGEISPDDVCVEVYYGSPGKDGRIENAKTQRMECKEKTGERSYRYETDIVLSDGGDYLYTFRVVPENGYLIDRFEMGLVKWFTGS